MCRLPADLGCELRHGPGLGQGDSHSPVPPSACSTMPRYRYEADLFQKLLFINIFYKYIINVYSYFPMYIYIHYISLFKYIPLYTSNICNVCATLLTYPADGLPGALFVPAHLADPNTRLLHCCGAGKDLPGYHCQLQPDTRKAALLHRD